jgi:hypothetical protein
MRKLWTSSLGLLLAVGLARAAEKTPPAPPLSATHTNPSATVRLHTPVAWRMTSSTGQPEMLEVRGDGLVVRILRREGELGLDSLHVECMLVRLAGAMETSPQVDYEYDFLGGSYADRRVLDSAFKVHYDEPVEGHRDWRQRNLTLVGGGESLCVISYVPVRVWKKSKTARNLLKAVLESVELAPWP